MTFQKYLGRRKPKSYAIIKERREKSLKKLSIVSSVIEQSS